MYWKWLCTILLVNLGWGAGVVCVKLINLVNIYIGLKQVLSNLLLSSSVCSLLYENYLLATGRRTVKATSCIGDFFSTCLIEFLKIHLSLNLFPIIHSLKSFVVCIFGIDTSDNNCLTRERARDYLITRRPSLVMELSSPNVETSKTNL